MTPESPFIRSTPADLTAGSSGMISAAADRTVVKPEISSSNVNLAPKQPEDFSTNVDWTARLSTVSFCIVENFSGRKKMALYGVFLTFCSCFVTLTAADRISVFSFALSTLNDGSSSLSHAINLVFIGFSVLPSARQS